MSKFLINLLLQISKALVNLKIQLLIWKFFSLLSARLTLRPVRPLAQPTCRPRHPHRPKQSWPAHPARASVASSWEICFPFRITPSRAGRLSLVSLSTGPHLSDSPPSLRRPTPVRNPPCRRLPRATASRLGCPELLQPSLITLPLNPLQTEP
jgi:hypothetical protein